LRELLNNRYDLTRLIKSHISQTSYMLDIVNIQDQRIKNLAFSIQLGERLEVNDAVYLFDNAPLSLLAFLADKIKKKLHGKNVYYNKNFHIEPTNVCVFNCDFCSFSTLDEKTGWKKSHQEIINIIKDKAIYGVSELHITGGANPDYNISFYTTLFKEIKSLFPTLHIKAFTAVEIDYMAKLAKTDAVNILQLLKEAGLDSMPGGGAEILDKEIRNVICINKTSAEKWLEIHETAHSIGIHSNATMLYGHIEKTIHRIEHLNKLRILQDKTKGFNTFIPLKYRNKNNRLSTIDETPLLDDLKTFSISRIFLDNFAHIKAYWPMIGKDNAKLLLNFGVDDLDGTIQNTTKIYSMAGSNEDSPNMTEDELRNLIIDAGFIPVERDSLYNVVGSNVR
jgi:aminodeoxyfutalosine synthase